MDPRIREQAEVIVDHSTDIQPGDNVVVSGPEIAEDLIVAVHELLGDRGATPVYMGNSPRSDRAFLRSVDPDDLETPEHVLAMYEASDVLIRIRATENATEQSDVPGEAQAQKSVAGRPVQEAALASRWCLTQFPTKAQAQLAEMSLEAYENFVWDATNKDWDAVREHQARMVDILDPADEVRIVSGDTTDVTMSVAGNPCLNDDGEHNLPGGEVFTTPVPDSVEGEVLFDKPVYQQGREILDASLVFEDGEVVEHSAEKNEGVLTSILERGGADEHPRDRRGGAAPRRARHRDEPRHRPVHLQHAVRREDGRHRPHGRRPGLRRGRRRGERGEPVCPAR
jgi:aminopeptidase